MPSPKPLARRLAVLVVAIAAALVGSCLSDDPNAPLTPLSFSDPMVGFLKPLGDIPLFAKREFPPDYTPLGSEYFDTNGVGDPSLIAGSWEDFTLYYVGYDATMSQKSGGIGMAQSSDNGFTFENRRLLLARRNRITGDLYPLDPPSPLPPRLTDSYDSPGVLGPMVLPDCGLLPSSGDCLFYSGPGIFDSLNDDDQDGLRIGLSNEFVRPPDPPDRPIPLVPSAIGMVAVPDLGHVASNSVPILMANKEIDDDGAPDCGLSISDPLNPSKGQLPCTDDNFYTERADSFDPEVEVCARRSFTAAQFATLSGNELNTTANIEAGPYPWESGGVGDPYVIADPWDPERLLLYYTCTEEYGEVTENGCEERLIDRICVAELDRIGDQVVARRLLMEPEDVEVPYASPSNSDEFLANNIVLGPNGFASVGDHLFDASGVAAPTILRSPLPGIPRLVMWYTGKGANGANRIGISGSFDGLHWDVNHEELRVKYPCVPVLGLFSPCAVPTWFVLENPVLASALPARVPGAVFANDGLLRVLYESKDVNERYINMASVFSITDDVPPHIAVESPQPPELDQGCDVTFAFRFEDIGGSGIDQGSIDISFDNILINSVPSVSTQVHAINEITEESLYIGQDADWSDEFPSLRFDSPDSADTMLTLEGFQLNPTLAAGDQALIQFSIEIFDRNDNRTVQEFTLTMFEAGTPGACDPL